MALFPGTLCDPYYLNPRTTPFSTFRITFHIFLTGGNRELNNFGRWIDHSPRPRMTNRFEKVQGQVTWRVYFLRQQSLSLERL